MFVREGGSLGPQGPMDFAVSIKLLFLGEIESLSLGKRGNDLRQIRLRI